MADIAAKIAEKKEELALLKKRRMEIISYGQSYSIKNGDDSRSLENVPLAKIQEMIKALEGEIEDLEYMLSHNGRSSKYLQIGMRW